MADTEQLRMTVITLSSEVVKQPATLVAAVSYLVYESINNRAAFIALIALLSVPACVVPIRMVARRLVRRSRLVGMVRIVEMQPGEERFLPRFGEPGQGALDHLGPVALHAQHLVASRRPRANSSS
jgi:hypothetical protein